MKNDFDLKNSKTCYFSVEVKNHLTHKLYVLNFGKVRKFCRSQL